jgi:DNA-binding NarL/FixJ family response regulator
MMMLNMNHLYEKIIRLLIVDDVLEVREGIRTVLELSVQQKHLPIQVMGTANNGLEALKQVSILKPDVVLMDLEMPIMDGFKATRWIKKEWPHIQVIILSIHCGLSDQQEALDAGADICLAKGVSMQILLHHVKDCGRKRNLWKGNQDE